MRTSILLWSTASGLILGLFIDATLMGVALLLSAIVPGLSPRIQHRWMGITAVVIMSLIPIVLGVLGFLEGELKSI